MRINFIFFCLGNIIFGNLYPMELSKNNQPSTDLMYLQLQQANEEWFKKFGIVWKTDDFDFWHSPYKDPCVNGITRFSLTNKNKIIENINLIMDYSKQRSIPFSWSAYPDNNCHELDELFKKSKVAEEESVVMMHSLDTIIVNNIPEVSIEPLQKDDCKEWLAVFNNAFGEYDTNFTETYIQLIQKDLESIDASWKYFAGYFNKKLVTTGALLVCSHYGYIANIGTHQQYRGKGMATAIIVALLQEAKKLNMSYVFLQATDAARLYEKIGFQTVVHLKECVFGVDSSQKK